MKKAPLEKGSVWVIMDSIGPYDGYGVTVVDAVNAISHEAISFIGGQECVWLEGDRVIVFESRLEENKCMTHFVRPRDLFQTEVDVFGSSLWS